MGELGSVAKVHVIEGRSWKDALIRVLEPQSPYTPWHFADGIERGDAVIAVLDTDPVSVLAGVGIVGPDGDVAGAIDGIARFYLNGLLELGTLQMLADFHVRPEAGPVFHRRSPDDVVAIIGDYIPASSDALFGQTSLAAGRVLLNSGGRCTGCRRPLDLTGEGARDRVHIHTVDPLPFAMEGRSKSDIADWPAALCESCHDRMHRDGFTRFLDYRFSLHPRCPSCSAQRSMSAMYGKPSGPVEEPWIAVMGCVVAGPRKQWVCETCDHVWSQRLSPPGLPDA